MPQRAGAPVPAIVALDEGRPIPDPPGKGLHGEGWLRDAAPAKQVPRQLRLLDWLGAHVPADADAHPTFCRGDARPGNAIATGSEITTLVDVEGPGSATPSTPSTRASP